MIHGKILSCNFRKYSTVYQSIKMKKLFIVFQLLLCGIASCVVDPEKNNKTNADMEREKAFSDTLNGKKVQMFKLENKNGMSVEFSNYGATVLTIHVPNKEGKLENVLLSYDSAKDLFAGKSYFGCIVGRYANRIANGKFTIDGQPYAAPLNNGVNTLHGGVNSIDKQVWEARTMNDAISFSIKIKDGENGYPGNMTLKVIYSLRDDNSLVIDYEATTDKTTVINIANHAYFNLTGNPNNTILDHVLMINASRFTPVDSTLIPTGALQTVAGTPFDFTAAKPIGKDISADDQQIAYGLGYDHNFVLNTSDVKTPAVVVTEKTSGRKLEVFTTEPGVQFYSGNFLNGTEKGRGSAYQYRTGFCLETQHFPDSPNQPAFPSTLLKPGETWKSQTIYRFSTIQ